MKYAICNETFQNWSFDETCRAVAEAGYEGIELAPFTFTDDVRRFDTPARTQLLKTARDFGLTITGLHWLLLTPKGLSITQMILKSVRQPQST